MYKDLVKKAKTLEAVVRIGKNGITENVIQDITTNLKRHKLTKIKMLKSCIEENDKRKIAEKIAKVTDSEIILMTGFTFVIWRQ